MANPNRADFARFTLKTIGIESDDELAAVYMQPVGGQSAQGPAHPGFLIPAPPDADPIEWRRAAIASPRFVDFNDVR